MYMQGVGHVGDPILVTMSNKYEQCSKYSWPFWPAAADCENNAIRFFSKLT